MTKHAKLRMYVYGIALAAGPLAIAYGAISQEEWPLWAALAGAVLVPGLAMANVNQNSASAQDADILTRRYADSRPGLDWAAAQSDRESGGKHVKRE